MTIWSRRIRNCALINVGDREGVLGEETDDAGTS
jgi:hypothetical protein